ncbi:MAG: DUF4956 domain-containing protein [Clostridioides sp.]|nr:DUF4956 domain-containing protein [Clostridioides sp.]
MFDTIFGTIATDTSFTIGNSSLSLGVALLLGFMISIVYMKTHDTRTPERGFAITLVILPAVVTIIILLVGNSVARAFSLAGAFQIIRFRSTPGKPKDITYVLFSMAVGLSCGMGYLVYGVIVAVILCSVIVLIEALKFGVPKQSQKELKITIPENLDYQYAFDEILQKYTVDYRLIKIKTADLGSVYVLKYAIISKSATNEKEFIDELRTKNGNMNITLTIGEVEF